MYSSKELELNADSEDGAMTISRVDGEGCVEFELRTVQDELHCTRDAPWSTGNRRRMQLPPVDVQLENGEPAVLGKLSSRRVADVILADGNAPCAAEIW